MTINNPSPIQKIPEKIRASIIKWAEHNLFQEEEPNEPGELVLNLGGDYVQDEAFLYIDGVDYYVFANRSRGETDIKIKTINKFSDLPAMLPSEIPWELYQRLEKKDSASNKGWIRRII